MDTQLLAVIVSGALSLVSGFGSIMLKDHLDRKREARSAQIATHSGTEHMVPPPVPKVKSPSRFLNLLLIMLTITGGFASGVLIESIGSSGIIYLPAMIIGSVLLLILYARRRWRSALGYQFAILAQWSAFLAGAYSGRGNLREDSFYAVSGFWLGAAMIGILTFAATRRRSGG